MSQLSDNLSVRDLLVSYDRGIDWLAKEAVNSDSGVDRLQVLHQLRRSVTVHDSVVRSVLCPILESLPNGQDISSALLQGTDQRSDLLVSFRQLSSGASPYNVYAMNGPELDEILLALADSFRHHEETETIAVGWLLEDTSTNTDPEVVAARMALQVSRAWTRNERTTDRHPRSTIRERVFQYKDNLHNWNDGHHG
ncbi:MAG: hypothetical protein ACP5P1_11520 [Acidimicrobiales bacterium]